MTHIIPELVNIVSRSAPLLATAFGSPLAGMAINLIGNAIGASSNSQEEILGKLGSTDNAAGILQEIERKYMPMITGLTGNLGKISSIELNLKISLEQVTAM